MTTPKKNKKEKEIKVTKSDLLLFSKIIADLKKDLVDFKKDYPLAPTPQKQPTGPTLNQVLSSSNLPLTPADVAFDADIRISMPRSLEAKKTMEEFTKELISLMRKYKIMKVNAYFLSKKM